MILKCNTFENQDSSALNGGAEFGQLARTEYKVIISMSHSELEQYFLTANLSSRKFQNWAQGHLQAACQRLRLMRRERKSAQVLALVEKKGLRGGSLTFEDCGDYFCDNWEETDCAVTAVCPAPDFSSSCPHRAVSSSSMFGLLLTTELFYVV